MDPVRTKAILDPDIVDGGEDVIRANCGEPHAVLVLDVVRDAEAGLAEGPTTRPRRSGRECGS